MSTNGGKGTRRRRGGREVVDVGYAPAEVEAILRHYLGRGDVRGLMVIAELDGGAFDAKMTSTANVAERVGRLELLKDMVIDDAEED